MEDEIEDLLREEYKRLKIEVRYINFREYRIIIKINESYQIFYKWDFTLTNSINIEIISKKINDIIIKYYKGEI